MDRNGFIKKGLAVAIIFLFMGMSVIPSTGTVVEKKFSMLTNYDGNTLYVGGSGPGNYSKIQDAIDNASDGDTVFVYDDSSPYYENVVLDKSIDLIGEDRNTTIIDGENGNDNIVYVSADWVNIYGFTIRNSGWSNYSWNAGIAVISNNNNISSSNIMNTVSGIYFNYSENNNISDNDILGNGCGISFFSSNNNNITTNNISNNSCGISFYHNSNNNTVSNNGISNNRGEGIAITDSNNNNFLSNSFINDGFRFGSSYYNTFFNNTLNGKPIIYLEDESHTVIENNAGQIILVNCYNITIDNQELFNVAVGITLLDSDNCSISNNTIGDNSYSIYLRSSSYNTITGNIMLNSGTFYLHTSTNNFIAENELLGSGDIYLFSSYNNIIISNIISDNSGGLYLQSSSNNEIMNNTITDSHEIFIECSSNDNIISGNYITDNQKGIYIFESDGNTINGNIITNNSEEGIRLYNSLNNLIYNNYFYNTNNAWDNGNNDWNTTKTPGTNIINGSYMGGNYWSNFDEPNEGAYDNNSDGIGDTPYDIPGGDNQDRYPLMRPYGQTELEITKVNGGIFSFTIKNIGDETALNVSWSIYFEGGIVLPREQHSFNNYNLAPDEERTIVFWPSYIPEDRHLVFGIGRVIITMVANADNAEKVTEIIGGFIIFIFIIIR